MDDDHVLPILLRGGGNDTSDFKIVYDGSSQLCVQRLHCINVFRLGIQPILNKKQMTKYEGTHV